MSVDGSADVPGDISRDELSADQLADILLHGELEIVGRLTDASNVTLLTQAALDGIAVDCVYKPVRGERPLWDFPDGTLAAREVGAALVARAADWNCVPLTLMRDGPLGTGMVQQWIPDTESERMVDLFALDSVPARWLPVLRAVDSDGEPVVLAHNDDPRLQVLAAFDLVVNNADRKGTHVLPVRDGPVYGVDHGLTLHREDKLRTVLWGWAGWRLPEPVLRGLAALRGALSGSLGEVLGQMLTAREIAALRDRVERLTVRPLFDRPPEHRTPIPWPPL